MICGVVVCGVHIHLVGLFRLLHTFPSAYKSAERRDCKRTQAAEGTHACSESTTKTKNRTQIRRVVVAACTMWEFFSHFIFHFCHVFIYVKSWIKNEGKKLHRPTCTTSTRNWIGNASLLHARILAHTLAHAHIFHRRRWRIFDCVLWFIYRGISAL